MNRRRRRIGWLVLAAAAATLAAGCGIPPTRADFVARIAENNRNVYRTMLTFRDTLKPLSDGKNPDPSAVRQAYQNIGKALDEARTMADGMLLPPASTTAPDLLKAYKAYLDAEKELVDGPLKQVVDKLEEPADGGPSPDERRTFVNDRFKEMTDKEKANMKDLETVESSYDSAHNFTATGFKEYIDMQKNNK